MSSVPIRLENLVKELEASIVQAAQEQYAKLVEEKEYYDIYQERTEYVKYLVFNAVSNKNVKKIAEAIADAVDEVAKRHNLETDFGDDDFVFYDCIIPVESVTVKINRNVDYIYYTKAIEVWVNVPIENLVYNPKIIEVELKVIHRDLQEVFREPVQDVEDP